MPPVQHSTHSTRQPCQSAGTPLLSGSAATACGRAPCRPAAHQHGVTQQQHNAVNNNDTPTGGHEHRRTFVAPTNAAWIWSVLNDTGGSSPRLTVRPAAAPASSLASSPAAPSSMACASSPSRAPPPSLVLARRDVPRLPLPAGSAAVLLLRDAWQSGAAQPRSTQRPASPTTQHTTPQWRKLTSTSATALDTRVSATGF